ncbi:MAG: bifunctional phosphoserine phosphatase/homoserine phosphotransferase ThrH [Candidatus Omnitrophica bacterium]|nr:bifunctional phosphoserine phosphatase/homoserine phosphotransferase ThrH [Candidatus Omnitrophota bacterium]
MSEVICLDLEGVLMPEVWINVAKKTGIAELKRTTRDEPDYDKLMRYRIGILHREKIRLKDIQKVIGTLKPLPGAKAFLTRLRACRQVIILSDTFYEFAEPMMKALDYPTLFCNFLNVKASGYIRSHRMRQHNGKEQSVRALQTLKFRVRAAGDSYNDITMLKAANRGVLFCPPPNVVKDFPQFQVTRTYPALFKALTDGR